MADLDDEAYKVIGEAFLDTIIEKIIKRKLGRCDNCKYFDHYNVECKKLHNPEPPYSDWYCADWEKE